MHIQWVESWGRGENRGTGAMNQKYVQSFYLQVGRNQRMRDRFVAVLLCLLNKHWETEAH